MQLTTVDSRPTRIFSQDLKPTHAGQEPLVTDHFQVLGLHALTRAGVFDFHPGLLAHAVRLN